LLVAQEHLQIFLRNFAYGVATPVAVFKVSVFNLDAMRLALCRASFFVESFVKLSRRRVDELFGRRER